MGRKKSNQEIKKDVEDIKAAIQNMESEAKSRERAIHRQIEKELQDFKNKKGKFDPNWEWKQRNYEGLQHLRAIGLLVLLAFIIFLFGYLFDL